MQGIEKTNWKVIWHERNKEAWVTGQESTHVYVVAAQEQGVVGRCENLPQCQSYSCFGVDYSIHAPLLF